MLAGCAHRARTQLQPESWQVGPRAIWVYPPWLATVCTFSALQRQQARETGSRCLPLARTRFFSSTDGRSRRPRRSHALVPAGRGEFQPCAHQACMVIIGTSHAHIDIVGIYLSRMVIINIGVAFTINTGTSHRSRLLAISC